MPSKHKSTSAAQPPLPKRTCASLATNRKGPQEKRSKTRLSSRIRNCRNDIPLTASQSVPPSLSPVSSESSISTSTAIQGPSPPNSSTLIGVGLNAPNKLLGQLSNVLQQLTLAMQGNTTLPYKPVPISNAPLQVEDHSDALSEVSIQQQQHDTVPCATSGTRTIPGAVTTTTVGRTPQLGTVSLPPVTPRTCGKGDIQFIIILDNEKPKRVIMRDTLYVPKLTCSLFSVRATVMKGNAVEFENGSYMIYNRNGILLGTGSLVLPPES